MNEAQVRTMEHVRAALAGTQQLQFQAARDDSGRYQWLESVLRRFGYRQRGRSDRGALRAWPQHFSGYSRAACRADHAPPALAGLCAPVSEREAEAGADPENLAPCRHLGICRRHMQWQQLQKF